jgi:hypothetical protein
MKILKSIFELPFCNLIANVCLIVFDNSPDENRESFIPNSVIENPISSTGLTISRTNGKIFSYSVSLIVKIFLSSS